MNERFEQIAIGKIVASKTNPRKHFDEKQQAELVLSIREKGIVVPVLVRPLGEKYEVVAGERRYRSAKELKLESVPCIVRELTDEQALEIQVIENLQRADVHPLDEAEGFAQLIAKGNHTAETIAGKVGKSKTWVEQTLKLNALIPELKKAFWTEKINRTVAVYVCRYSTDVQLEVFKQDVRGDNTPSLRNVKATIEQEQRSLSTGPWKKDDANLVPAAGACNTCSKRTGASPSLFPELKKNDVCLDTDCFMKKLAAHAQRSVDRLEESGEKVITITDTYSPRIKVDAGPAAMRHDWNRKISEKPEKGLVPAVITQSDNTEDIGKTVYIGKPGKSSSSSDSESTSNRPSKAQLFKKRIERTAVDRIVTALMEKAAVPQLPQAALAQIVHNEVGHYLSGEQERGFEKFLGYKNRKAIVSVVNNPKTSIGDLHKIIVLSLNMPGQYGAPQLLETFAKIFKIDTAAIRRKTKQEMEAAQKSKESSSKTVAKEKAKSKRTAKSTSAKETAAAIAHSKNATTAVGVGKKPVKKKK